MSAEDRKLSLEHVFDQATHLSTVDRLRLSQRLTASIEHELVASNFQSSSKRQKKNVVPVELEKLTYDIIGCAFDVHNKHGPGFRENTYQRDLETQLTYANILYTPQKSFEVYDSKHDSKLIGYYIPDFVVDDRVIVEIKALRGLDNSHLAQMIGYLAISGCQVGLLINFGQRSLETKRILPPKKIQEHRVNRQWLYVPDWVKNVSADSGTD